MFLLLSYKLTYNSKSSLGKRKGWKKESQKICSQSMDACTILDLTVLLQVQQTLLWKSDIRKSSNVILEEN